MAEDRVRPDHPSEQRDNFDKDRHATRNPSTHTATPDPANPATDPGADPGAQVPRRNTSADADMGLGIEPPSDYDAVQGRVPTQAEAEENGDVT